MIEYDDKILGKVKLVNVTEARANFASVLSDAQTYVITKNNKPRRVIISFEDYQKILSDSGQAGDTQKTQEMASSVVEETKPRKNKDPIAGILADRMEKALGPAAQAQWEVESLSNQEPIAPQVATQVEPKPIEDDLQSVREEAGEGSGGDFDQAAHGLDLELPDPLSHSDYFFEPESEASFVEKPEPAELAPQAKFAETAPVLETDTLEEEIKTETAAAPGSRLSAEREAYYQKYRKLYESIDEQEDLVPAEQVVIKPAKIINDDDDLWDDPELSAILAEEMSEDELTQAAPMAENDQEPEDLSSQTVLPAAQPHAPPPASWQNAKPRRENAPGPTSSGELPSLQELLSDLDSVNLSDEQGNPLPDSDVDKLLNRIREDL